MAFQILRRQGAGQPFTERLLEESEQGNPLSGSDRGLFQELVYGVTRWRRTLDALVSLKTHGRNQKESLLILLRLGLYQLFWLDRIPPHAAINETVALAKRTGFKFQAGFVNAVLRNCVREEQALRDLIRSWQSETPALGWSHPDWLWERWNRIWGRDRAMELLVWNNTSARTFARRNSLKAGRERLEHQWNQEGVSYQAMDFHWVEPGTVYQLNAHPKLSGLESFNKGWFYLQDPSTLFAVSALSLDPALRVLDVCAAPGGKATFAAQIMQDQGRVAACDLDPNRLERIRDNTKRLGLQSISVLSWEEASRSAEVGSEFDRVLIDAPCSNTGVMRRRVDLRWRLQEKDLARLAQQQFELLEQFAGSVKPSGLLVYSTCSLEPEENRNVVERFLNEPTEKASVPSFEWKMEGKLTPWADQVDGAYVAVLQRKPD